MSSDDWFARMEDGLWLRPDETGAEEARFIKKSLHLRKGQAVLDAPCGAGRIAYHLARAGCEVSGVDLRQGLIDRARRRFRAERLPGTFTISDLRSISYRNQYHCVFNWGGSFGYFDDTENANLIWAYARALRPGGRLLVQQRNRERLLRCFAERMQPNERLAIRNNWDHTKQRVISRRILDGREEKDNRSSMRMYTPSQMRRLFEAAGLIVENVYGSLKGDPYLKSSPLMIMVGKQG